MIYNLNYTQTEESQWLKSFPLWSWWETLQLNVRQPVCTSGILAFPAILQGFCTSFCLLNRPSVVEGEGKAEATFSIPNDSQKYSLIFLSFLPWNQTLDLRLKISLLVGRQISLRHETKEKLWNQTPPRALLPNKARKCILRNMVQAHRSSWKPTWLWFTTHTKGVSILWENNTCWSPPELSFPILLCIKYSINSPYREKLFGQLSVN